MSNRLFFVSFFQKRNVCLCKIIYNKHAAILPGLFLEGMFSRGIQEKSSPGSVVRSQGIGSAERGARIRSRTRNLKALTTDYFFSGSRLWSA